MDRYIQTALEPTARQLHRAALQIFQHSRRAIPVAEAVSTDLDRRSLPCRIASNRTAWRRLASGRRHRRLAASAARDAGASGYAETQDRSRGARFLGSDEVLHSTAVYMRDD